MVNCKGGLLGLLWCAALTGCVFPLNSVMRVEEQCRSRYPVSAKDQQQCVNDGMRERNRIEADTRR